MKINDKNLAAFSVSPTTVHRDGYLLKQGENNRAFLKRWFVLKGNLLFYFEKKGDKEPIGVIIIEGCTIELAEHEEQICCFRIVFPAREYVLAADNQENLEQWMKSLARSSYSYLKLMVAELEMQLKELDGALATSNESSKENSSSNNTHSITSNSSSSSASSHGRHRLNPFNTAEENEAIIKSLGDEAASTSMEHIRSSNSQTQPSETQNLPAPVRPVPPKRLKKPRASTSAKSSCDLTSGSDGKTSNLCHCRELGAASCACCRKYFLFQQLHLDYGAPILRDREMHRLLSSSKTSL